MDAHPFYNRSRFPVFRLLALGMALLGSLFYAPLPAQAAAALTIEPITWNVIGLDSNNVNVGPDTFLVGARVCNVGDAPATNVVSNFVWDSANALINLQGPSSLSEPTLAAGACTDFYYNVVVTRNANAYDTTREYHITATADGLGTVSTPQPRELYVEHLVSQNRNSIVSITGPQTVYVGQTYTYTVVSDTAPNGYEQLSAFLDFPNLIFQIEAVSVTYTAPPGGTGDTVYADGCGWINDPTDPNYLSCSGTGNYGGTVTTTYTVTILSAGTATMTPLIYDFSGSSFHYNSDFNTTVFAVTAYNPPSIAVTKTANPASVPEPGGSVTFTVTIANTSDIDSVTITSLTDSVYGNLNGQGSCAVPQTIPVGGNYTCSFTATVSGDTGFAETNTVTASGTGGPQLPVSGSASATVTVTDVLPAVALSKSVTPASLPAPGGTFTYTLTIQNISVEPVTITALTDTFPLSAQCLALVGTTLPAGASTSCQYTVVHTAPGDYPNTAVVTVQDNEGNQAADDGSATVTVEAATDTPTPTDTPTNTPTNTPTDTPTNTPTNTPTHTPTDTPTNTPTHTPTDTPTNTPTGTLLPTDTPTNTPTFTPTFTPTDTPTVGPPGIAVSKIAVPDNLPAPGGSVAFMVRVDNAGPAEVTIDSLSDSVYGDITAVTGEMQATTCAVPQIIPAGSFYQCSFMVTFTGDAGFSETDMLTASGTDQAGAPVSASGQATVTLTEPATPTPLTPVPTAPAPQPTQPPAAPLIVYFDPAISKLGVLEPGGLGLPGEVITWMFTISNVGTGRGTDVVVCDEFRPELTIVSSQTDRGTVSTTGQQVCFAIPYLDPGERIGARITTRIAISPQDGVIENLVTMTGIDPDGSTKTASDDTSLMVITTLPSTGYPPAPDDGLLPAALAVAGGLVALIALGWGVWRRRKAA